MPAARCDAGFGSLLRGWRAKRRMTQTDLAVAAHVSTRHISYLENGLAQTTVEMLLRCADALEIPPRDRNTLLVAAGFMPLYRETGLDAPEMKQVRETLAWFLENQEPFPAAVTDRYEMIQMTNQACERTFDLFFDQQALWGDGPRNANDILLSPLGMRPHVQNWEAAARWMLLQCHRQTQTHPRDPVSERVFERILGMPGVGELWTGPEPGSAVAPFFDCSLRKFGASLDGRIAFMTFGMPHDSQVEELRIMLIYPRNEGARRLLHWLHRTRGLLALSNFR
ncbi:MAG: helix-turn-helix domain-containing protein [Nevskia sp.]|nr:helix-turn-helix domain-containing protein [Nevskia sp.]